jgi:hypothetical protein
MQLPKIGALWIGGGLTWLEQLCLSSFVAHGHETILYTYGPVHGVPEGIIVSDGHEIIATDDFLTHSRTQSVALFSDLFRFHMIKKYPDIVYVDTDVFCLRPLDLPNPFLFGFETYHGRGVGQLNGAVLRLPPESAILSEMIDFMTDLHPQIDWLGSKATAEIEARKKAGVPMHVTEMKWGVWGPLGISHFARKTGEIEHACLPEVFYPLHFRDRRLLFRLPRRVESVLNENSYTIHMWAPIKRLAAAKFDGLCPPDSYIGHQLEFYGIDPCLAPVPRRNKLEVVY